MSLSQQRLADYKSGRLNMSKRTRMFLAAVAVSCILATSVSLGTRSSAAQRKGTPAMASRIAKNAAIVATTEAVLQDTSEIRDLAILRPVKSGAQSRAE